MNGNLLGKLILYIIYKAKDYGGYTTTIRLVKYLYLIDVEYYRRYGRTLTGLNWIYHYYGPYAFELPELGNRLGFDLEREDFTSKEGVNGVFFNVRSLIDFPEELNYSDQRIVDGILGIWALEDTAEILAYTYQTEPMRLVNYPGGKLDFNEIPKGTKFFELYLPTNKKVVKKIQESISQFLDTEQKEFVTPKTVVDKTLEDGLKALEDLPLADLSGIKAQISKDFDPTDTLPGDS